MAAHPPTRSRRRAGAWLALLALAFPIATGSAAQAADAETYETYITYPRTGSVVEGPTIEAHGLVKPRDQTSAPWMDVLFAVDLSGSTDRPAGMDCNGDGQVTEGLAGDDLNADGSVGDVLDCEIGAVAALTADLRTRPGAADRMGVAVAGFGSRAVIARAMTEEMQRAAEAELGHPVDPFWVAPGATGDGRDVLPRLSTVASGLRRGQISQYEAAWVGQGTDFRAALTTAMAAFAERDGSALLLLLSDGESWIDQATLSDLATSGIRARTFAIGAAAGACRPGTALARIAAATGEECVQVTDPAALTTRLVDSRPAGLDRVEVTMDGRTVTADVDALGRWSVQLSPTRTGQHFLRATAIYADGSTSEETSRFQVTGVTSRYVALGDSYASGEGVEPYTDDDQSMTWGLTPATEDYLCHRSQVGWPTTVTLPGESAAVRDLAAGDDTHQFVSVACSGARMVNLDTVQQAKPWPYPPPGADEEYLVPRQLDALTPDTDLVTVSIGGNDIGFTPIVMHCLTQLHCQRDGFVNRADGTSLSLHDWASIRLALVGAELTSVYTAITERTGPETAVVALTYPRLVADRPSTSWQLTCRPGTLQNDERDWLRAAADTFAAVLARRAASAGVAVADVRDAFEGHLVCDGDAWLFPAQLHREVDLPSTGFIGAASFHPNQRGVAAYTRVVNAAVEEALLPPSTGGATTFDATALDMSAATSDVFDQRVVTDPEAVLAGYPVDVVDWVRRTTVDTATVLAGPEARCGDTAGIGELVPVGGDGFAPDEPVQGTVIDDTGRVLASATAQAAADGTVRATLPVPSDLPHDTVLEVRLDGADDDGDPVLAVGILPATTDPSCAAVGESTGGDAPGDPTGGDAAGGAPGGDAAEAPGSDTHAPSGDGSDRATPADDGLVDAPASDRPGVSERSDSSGERRPTSPVASTSGEPSRPSLGGVPPSDRNPGPAEDVIAPAAKPSPTPTLPPHAMGASARSASATTPIVWWLVVGVTVLLLAGCRIMARKRPDGPVSRR